MNKKEFSKIRRHLGKSQREVAQLLGISTKATQSFEQGWRSIPPHVERQTLFLFAMKAGRDEERVPMCWEAKKCSAETRESCPA